MQASEHGVQRDDTVAGGADVEGDPPGARLVRK
jgi:hypothetical protein